MGLVLWIPEKVLRGIWVYKLDFKNIEKSTRGILGFEKRIKEVDSIAFQTVIQG